MAKSRAEIQKAYRERKKALNKDEYLRKERERRRKNYVPSGQLSRRDRLRRNIKNNEILKRHRQKKIEQMRMALEEAEGDSDQNDAETSGYGSIGSHDESIQERLLVRMPFRRNGPRKRIGRALSKKNRELSKIKSTYETLQRKYKTTLRKLQRLKKKENTKEPRTPRSKTEALIREAGVNPNRAVQIRKQLLFTNALIEEVKIARETNNPGKRKILRNVVAGRIIKKYRCVNMLSKRLGLGRNNVGRATTNCMNQNIQVRSREVRRYRDDVISFMERDDNSRNMPGKANKVKTGVHSSTQTRVLTDYLSNLHAKFLSENPSIKLSLSSFKRIRPKYIRVTAFITRDSCLCTKHQNMALILKALRHENIAVPNNPETFLEDPCIDNICQDICKEEISFDQWKRVTIEEKGKNKMVMKIVKVVKTKEEFIIFLKNQTQEFQNHVSRMKTQYEQIRLLKDNLPLHHAILHMDFAENYACKTLEEIQSAYWNQQSVTLHPVVIYTRESTGEPVKHRSFVLISDDLNHNASTVLTFVKEIINDVKEIDPDIQCLHYWTDSPMSQYRNKTIFNFIANHEKTTGIRARWNYFEAGHGKGLCDGLGGITKRMADEAMKTGKVVIQDAKDFFAWTQSSSCTMHNVKFRFVPKEKCENTGKQLETFTTKTIKGTMKIHAVVGQGSNSVLVRNVSCYCDVCLHGGHCKLWSSETTSDSNSLSHQTEECSSSIETQISQHQDEHVETYSTGDYVIATYEGKWYLGKIVETDPDDEDGFAYNVSCMDQKKKMFQWPRRQDEIWRKISDIKCKVNTPIPSGKSNRMYKLNNEDWEKIATITDS